MRSGSSTKNNKDSSTPDRSTAHWRRPLLRQISCSLALAVTLLPTVAQAQRGILGELGRALERQQRQTSQANREQQEMLDRIAGYINSTPDTACNMPQSDIEKYLTEQANEHGLMDNIARTVFQRELRPSPENGYEALRRKVAEETRQRYAQSQAAYQSQETGQPAPVGDQPTADPPPYWAQLSDIKATSRIENGLLCSANVKIDFLRFAVTYDFTLDDTQSDGWSAHLQSPQFTEESALAEASGLRVRYDGYDRSLADARQQSRADRDSLAAAEARSTQQASQNAARCRAIEPQVIALMRTKKITIFEIANAFASAAGPDITCKGTAYSDQGRLFIAYGLTTTPQGRRLVEAEVLN